MQTYNSFKIENKLPNYFYDGYEKIYTVIFTVIINLLPILEVELVQKSKHELKSAITNSNIGSRTILNKMSNVQMFEMSKIHFEI